MAERKINLAKNLHTSDPEIGGWMWAIEECRHRTEEVLENISPEELDWQGPAFDHSIGTLLYHIAAIEADWLFEEIMEKKGPAELWDWFPHDVRESSGRLTPVKGLSIEQHRERLNYVRLLLLETLTFMDGADFHRARQFEPYDVDPAWVINHLIMHESEHRQEIALIRSAARKALGLDK